MIIMVTFCPIIYLLEKIMGSEEQKMQKIIVGIILGIVFLVIGNIFKWENVSDFTVAGAIIITTLVLEIIVPFIVDVKHMKFNLMLLWLITKREKIRFSMSYQLIIKIDGSYLLVKNSHSDYYQMVGGKYKVYPEGISILDDIRYQEDTKLPNDQYKKGDLAIYIPAKNAKKFLKWFESKKGREVSHWREFYEELIVGKNSKGILSKEIFSNIDYKYLSTIQTPIKKTPPETGWNTWEMLQYDIFEVKLAPNQETELIKLKAEGDTDYIKWTTTSLIDSLGFDGSKQKTEYKIGIHTKWVKNQKWSKE